MTGSTHLAAGAALALTTGSLAAAAGILLGSILPDIDSSGSLLGRYVPFLGDVIPHRTFTHSLLFTLLVGLVSPYISAGVILHLLLDAMNPMGIKPLWPIQCKVRVPLLNRFMPQGGRADGAIGLICTLLAVSFTVLLLLQQKYGSLPWASNLPGFSALQPISLFREGLVG